VMFGSDTGVLQLDDAQDFHGTIAGISHTGHTDILRLSGFTAGDDVTASTGAFDSSHNVTTLTVVDHTHAQTLTLTLQGDYSTSLWTVTDDHNGQFDIVDPPASSSQLVGGVIMNDPGPSAAPAVIADGAAAEISGPSSGTVTFTGATGSLVIDHPADFTGHIAGFTGTAPDAEHSDTIDLVGIDFNSVQFTESYDAATGSLAVSDGSHSANFTFDNFKAMLDFASDGKGGTLITDPPPAGNNVAHSYGADGFRFNCDAGAQGQPVTNVTEWPAGQPNSKPAGLDPNGQADPVADLVHQIDPLHPLQPPGGDVASQIRAQLLSHHVDFHL